MRRLLWSGGLFAVLAMAGPNRATGQSAATETIAPPKPDQRRDDRVPEPTLMAVLATSLVGLCLAGLQKRRKG